MGKQSGPRPVPHTALILLDDGTGALRRGEAKGWKWGEFLVWRPDGGYNWSVVHLPSGRAAGRAACKDRQEAFRLAVLFDRLGDWWAPKWSDPDRDLVEQAAQVYGAFRRDGLAGAERKVKELLAGPPKTPTRE